MADVPEVFDKHFARIAFATNRFELFPDFGIRIKARSPAVQTFLSQLAADEGWTGTYLPSERAVANRGYGGGVIVEETVRAIYELWAEQSKGGEA